ncbi:xanthine dehydrogenase [Desulfuribacillus stibiiarsenatis]|uniref:Xanthine dehydrogenase n=1 Tax=Desulfuribacillus stibiiarsenatis TaxID=1390249 RepID=A0A1E5L2B0_9FIRM|nr:molybdopterin cofactor-binding domain-containing protein [Desulfuribacillus stibiiarsenatis]OEH84267.1 xanthine dehydrogenase [Desulfuribacillus stibiiarsenatis]
MLNISLQVNGVLIQREVDEKMTLLQFLRDNLGLLGAKNGCAKGHCGTCTIIIDGEAKRACLVRMGKVKDGSVIETIEGLSEDGELHPIQSAFVTEGAIQCGFCTPGMVLATKALLDKNLEPTDEEIKFALKNNLCRCTGYVTIFQAVRTAANMLQEMKKVNEQADQYNGKEFNQYTESQVMGVSKVRKDVVAKVTGKGIFADDYYAEDMLYGRLLFSTESHADILAIDTKEAESLPGVKLILTGKDIPGRNSFGLIVPQQPVLAEKRIRYLGEAVAAVFAETQEKADEAVKRIRVQYQPLPAVFSAVEGMEETAVKVHDAGNIVDHVKVRKGNLEKGFAKADIIIEGNYYTPAIEHAYLEPEACLVKPLFDGSIEIWTGNQGSIPFQDMIAKSLDMPLEKVRVIYTPCGGAFGGKEEPTVQIHAALAAIKTGLPVKMTMTREDSIRMSTKRHAVHIYMKHGVTKDGKLVAFESKAICDAGAYMSLTKPVVFRAAVVASGPYQIPNVKADSYGIYTNNNPAGAFRGFGSTQVSFAAEIQMDKLATALSMNPVEFRRLNGLDVGKETITGQVLRDGVGYLETLNVIDEAVKSKWTQWLNASKEKINSNTGTKKIGIGFASSYKNVGLGTGKPDFADAALELQENGRLLLKIGATDIGQGSDTVMAQIAAAVLHIDYELIDVISCDTALCPDGGMTTASRQTYVTGNAVKLAAEEWKQALNQLANRCSQRTDACMQFQGMAVEKQQSTLKTIYQCAKSKGTKLEVLTRYNPPTTYPLRASADHEAGVTVEEFDIHYAYCFGTHAALVEVDEDTGEVKVLSIFAAQDVGKAIHPQNVKGQIEGSVAMGVGYALSEEYIIQDNTIVTDTLAKLKIPKTLDIPEIETFIVEVDQPDGPLGAKGMGEIPINPVAPAIANAIYDAVGVRIHSLPIKAKVLKELIEQKA